MYIDKESLSLPALHDLDIYSQSSLCFIPPAKWHLRLKLAEHQGEQKTENYSRKKRMILLLGFIDDILCFLDRYRYY